MKTLLIMCPNPTDATSFYRGIHPLNELKKTLPYEVNFQYAQEINHAVLVAADGLFMQRPWKSQHLEIMKMAHANGVPVWVDYDDDLFNIPSSNPASVYYRDQNVQMGIAQMIADAEVATVSTEYLKERLLKLNGEIQVIPNAFNGRLLRYRRKPDEKRNKLIMWRGSETHQKDLYLYTKQLVEVAQEQPSWNFTFVGSGFWLTTEALPPKQTTVCESIDPIEYFQLIHKLQPAITIVPLHDNVFNRCKSNIAWQESTFAGALTLAPSWPEWKRPGVTCYQNPADFKTGLLELIQTVDNTPDVASQMVSDSWRDIQQNFLLSKVNEQREHCLNLLFSPESEKIVTEKMRR